MAKGLAFREFCMEHGIPIADVQDKHYRSGWVQVECPFCSGNAGHHLGYSIHEDYFNCWRCGWKPPELVLSTLSGSDRAEAKKLLREYKTVVRQDSTASFVPIKRVGRLKFPLTVDWTEKHSQYLKERKFKPNMLRRLWGLKATGHIGAYANRIIAPIRFKGQFVSFQGRDITGKHKLRYKACKKEKEVIDHKHTIYGMDHCSDSIVVVEGITDVWRLGYGAGATYGIKYTPEQVLLLSQFERRYVLFDTEDPQARAQGLKLAEELSTFPGYTEYVELDNDCRWINKKEGRDPANLTQACANEIMEELT